MSGEKDSKDTEDHYYVENCSRTSLILSSLAFFVITIFWHYISLPTESSVTIISGIEAYDAFYKETQSLYLFSATVFGIFTGLLISFLSEYFTS